MDRTLKIVVIDDDLAVSDSVQRYLSELGYCVFVVNDSQVAVDKIESVRPDLVILDVIMPNVDGIEICRSIRQLDYYYPIIMLTSKSDYIDKVVGLEIGADDYISKPFSLRELEARIKAVLRRGQIPTSPQDTTTLRHGPVRLDLQLRTCRIGSRTITLTPKEFDMMRLFMASPGRPIQRSELLERVWGGDYQGQHRTVDSHINRLRQKIEPNPDHPVIIGTVWGFGYKLNTEIDPVFIPIEE